MAKFANILCERPLWVTIKKTKTKPILDLIAKVVRTSKTYVIPEITCTVPAEGQKIHQVSNNVVGIIFPPPLLEIG